MKTKLLIFLALAAAMVTFTAESCFVSTKEVEVPVRGEGELEFHATGTSDSKHGRHRLHPAHGAIWRTTPTSISS